MAAGIAGALAGHPSGDGWTASCPAHDDRNPSLSIGERDGTVLVHCHAGCAQERVIEALRDRGLWPGPGDEATGIPGVPATWRGGKDAPPKRFVAAWAYRDAAGSITGYAVRYEGPDGTKDVIPFFRRDGAAWKAGAPPAPRPLFGLDRLAAHPDATVWVVEGEKCAAALHRLDLVAVTNQGGCQATGKADWSPLAGRTVIVWPDFDEAGWDHREAVLHHLARLAPPVACRVVDVAALDLPKAGDVVDWLRAHPDATAADLEALPMEASTPAAPVAGNAPWPEPVPLDRVNHPEPLDLALMPDPLAEVVGAVSEATQTPPELAWGVAVAVLATATGRRAKVALPTHVEPCPLWIGVFLPPGSRKSGVFGHLTAPLAAAEFRLKASWEEEHRQWWGRQQVAEASIQKLKNDVKKPDADREAIAKQIAVERAFLEKPPVQPCLFITDTTTEALRIALSTYGNVGLLSAEGSSLLEGFGRYNGGNRGADMALWLAAHAGDSDKGARVYAMRGCVEPLASIGITAQPDVLRTLGEDRMARGRGFLDRFLFLIPEDPRGRRDYNRSDTLPARIPKRWGDMVQHVLELEPAPMNEAIPKVKLAAASTPLWREFAQAIENRQGPGGDLRAMSGFASKLAGAVGRIALAYHLSRGGLPGGAIDPATMLQAIGVGHLLIDHARAALTLMGETEETTRARLILECLAHHRVETVKPRDVVTKGWGGCKSSDEARAALALLVRHHWCRPLKPSAKAGPGARPKDAYEVHPGIVQVLQDMQGGKPSESDVA